MKFNKLTFLEFTESKQTSTSRKRKMAAFQCECGDIKVYDFYSVKCSHTKQCFQCARSSASLKRKTHGLIKHPLYGRWQDMKNRCYNKNLDRYSSYGGRGIQVCQEWIDSFENYYNWCIDNGWEKGLSVDRIDVNGNYEPANCRVITLADQHYNKRNTLYISIDNKKYSLAKLLRDNNLSHKYALIHKQLKQGWEFKRHIEKYNIQLID